MKCADFEKMIYLNRKGEITNEERARLQAHLQECNACAALDAQLRAWTTSTLPRLQRRPLLENQGALLDSTMKRIDQLTKRRHIPGFDDMVEFVQTLSNVVFSRKIRFLLSTASFLLACFLVIQQGSILYQISELEQVMIRRGQTPEKVKSVSIRIANLSSLRHFDELNSAIETGILSVRKRGDELHIDRTLLTRLWHRYRTQLTDIPFKRKGIRSASIDDSEKLEKLSEAIIRDYRNITVVKKRLFGG